MAVDARTAMHVELVFASAKRVAVHAYQNRDDISAVVMNYCCSYCE